MLELLSSALLIVVVTLAVHFSSWRANAIDDGNETDSPIGDLSSMRYSMNIVIAVVAPLIASVVLLLLFWLLESSLVIWLLLAFSAVVVGFIGVAFVFSGFFRGRLPRIIVPSVITGAWVVSTVVSSRDPESVLSLFVWILNDVICLCLCVFYVNMFRFRSVKVAGVLCLGMFFYDLFWVFFSQKVFTTEGGVSVMESVAKVMIQLPVKFAVPRHFLHPETQGSMFFGMGDVLLPAMVGATLLGASPEETETGPHVLINSRTSWYYYLIFLLGYIVGATQAILMSFLSKSGQPALIYIVPWTFLPVLAVAWMNRDLESLWKRGWVPAVPEEESETCAAQEVV